MLLGFSRPRLRPTVEVLLVIALGIALAFLFNKAHGPAWTVEAISIDYDPETQQLVSNINATYTGGCHSVMLEQWIKHETLGDVRSIFNYSGPVRVSPGFKGVLTDATLIRKPLEPGYWLFEMSAICIQWNRSQTHFRLPTTRFLVRDVREVP